MNDYGEALTVVMGGFIAIWFVTQFVGVVFVALRARDKPHPLASYAYALSWLGAFFGPCWPVSLIVTMGLAGFALRETPNTATKCLSYISIASSLVWMAMFMALVVVVILYV